MPYLHSVQGEGIYCGRTALDAGLRRPAAVRNYGGRRAGNVERRKGGHGGRRCAALRVPLCPGPQRKSVRTACLTAARLRC